MLYYKVLYKHKKAKIHNTKDGGSKSTPKSLIVPHTPIVFVIFYLHLQAQTFTTHIFKQKK